MVSNLLLGALSRVQARRLREDEEGLSLLAYALGSAVIVGRLHTIVPEPMRRLRGTRYGIAAVASRPTLVCVPTFGQHAPSRRVRDPWLLATHHRPKGCEGAPDIPSQ